MHRVILMFKTFELGVLHYNKGLYVYNSNTENEKMAAEYVEMFKYKLNSSKDLTSDKLFPIFAEILRECMREDIIKAAGILASDDDFVRLVKISKLPFSKAGFYLKYKI